MYLREFENLLQRGELPKSMLLYGASEYRIEYCGKLILNFWAKGEEVFTLYFDDYDFSLAKKHLSQSSLFGDSNILCIKTDKNIPKKEADVLVGICAKNPHAYLLVQNYTEDAKAKSMASSFKKFSNADFVRFFKPNLNEALQILNLEAKNKRLNINNFALQHLLELQNENLSLAVSELDKFCIIDGEIGKKDVDRLVFGLGEVSLDEFIEKFINKKDIKKDFESLLDSGHYEDMFILNAIERYLCQLFSFHAYIKINGNFNTKDILGYPLPPQLAQKRAAQAMKMSLDSFDEALVCLTEAEYTLKKGSYKDKKTYLLSTILRVQSLL